MCHDWGSWPIAGILATDKLWGLESLADGQSAAGGFKCLRADWIFDLSKIGAMDLGLGLSFEGGTLISFLSGTGLEIREGVAETWEASESESDSIAEKKERKRKERLLDCIIPRCFIHRGDHLFPPKDQEFAGFLIL